jgi:hypothetical protein
VVAIERWLKYRPVARGPSRNSGSELIDYTGRLVPEHHRINALSISDRALGKIVQVGSAHSHRFYAHSNLAGTRFRTRPINEFEPVRPDQLSYAHSASLFFEKIIKGSARVAG